MSTPKHTSGPWKALVGSTSEYVVLSNSSLVCTINKPHITQDSTKKANIRLANARLIAAAPEMLKVLESTLAAFANTNDYDIKEITAATIAKIEAALKLAKGE